MQAMISKEKALDLAREAKFVVNEDKANNWHVIIGNERDLERLVNAIYNMNVVNANDMKFTTAGEYMRDKQSQCDAP